MIYYNLVCINIIILKGDEDLDKDRFLKFNTYLNDTQKSISRIKQRKMEHYGLGGAHVLCLCQLVDHPKGLTKTELVKKCGVDKAQISRVISDILEKDYVSVANPQASYRQKYALTEKGEDVAREIKQIILDINTFVSESIPQKDIEIFYNTFETICENLNKAEKLFDTRSNISDTN